MHKRRWNGAPDVVLAKFYLTTPQPSFLKSLNCTLEREILLSPFKAKHSASSYHTSCLLFFLGEAKGLHSCLPRWRNGRICRQTWWHGKARASRKFCSLLFDMSCVMFRRGSLVSMITRPKLPGGSSCRLVIACLRCKRAFQPNLTAKKDHVFNVFPARKYGKRKEI